MQYTRLLAAVAVVGSVLVGACGSSGSIQEGLISGPGGFADPVQRLAVAGDESYCSAEVVRWRYDEVGGSLQIANSRLQLNCCGQRGMSVARVDSMLEVTQRDEPEGEAGRCDAVCAFDFAVAVPEVEPGKVYLKLLRDVTDVQGSAQLVWEGELDLSAVAGSVVVDDAPATETCGEMSRLAAMGR